MKIKILGTGSGGGIPAPFCKCEVCKTAIKQHQMRSRCCVCINETVLIDFPIEIRYFTLKHDFNLTKVKSVFFTHSHGDHFNPMDLVMNYGVTTDINENNPLNIYGNDTLFNKLLTWINGNNSSVYNLVPLEPFRKYQVGSLTITPLPAKHDSNEACYIYLIIENNVSFLYCTDSDMLTDETMEYLKKFSISFAVFDCTWGGNVLLDKGHMGLYQIDIIRKFMLENNIADDNTIWGLTHFSHRSFTDDFISKAENSGYVILNDGVKFEV